VAFRNSIVLLLTAVTSQRLVCRLCGSHRPPVTCTNCLGSEELKPTHTNTQPNTTHPTSIKLREDKSCSAVYSEN